MIQGGREEKLHGNRGFIHNDERPVPIPKIVVDLCHIYRSTLCPETLRKISYGEKKTFRTALTN